MTRTMAMQYGAIRILALVVAAVLLVRERPAILRASYWRWLLSPWKIATAAISCLALAGAGPFMRDPDWDVGVSMIMSLLTFATAPWAIAELWRRRRASHVFVALCAWQLSASWSFDLYWLARRGFYPDNWLGNLLASSLLYLLAGLLWNLDATNRKWRLAFLDGKWPPDRAAQFRELAVPAIAIMAIAGACVFLPFLFLRA